MSDIMEWVYKGHTLIIVDNAERWAEFLADKEVLDYRGSKKLGTAWYGGNFFNREHPIFDGLPVNCVFNWEYQCFATYNRHRVGLRCFNGETLVACVSDHKRSLFCLVCYSGRSWKNNYYYIGYSCMYKGCQSLYSSC